MVDLDSDPTKLIEVIAIGKQLLITRGAITTFSIANDVAKYFAILPAMFVVAYPELNALNIMGLSDPAERHPLGGHLQRPDHRRPRPALPARRRLPGRAGGRAAAAQPAHLRRRRDHRPVPRASRRSTSSSPPSTWPRSPRCAASSRTQLWPAVVDPAGVHGHHRPRLPGRGDRRRPGRVPEPGQRLDDRRRRQDRRLEPDRPGLRRPEVLLGPAVRRRRERLRPDALGRLEPGPTSQALIDRITARVDAVRSGQRRRAGPGRPGDGLRLRPRPGHQPGRRRVPGARALRRRAA